MSVCIRKGVHRAHGECKGTDPRTVFAGACPSCHTMQTWAVKSFLATTAAHRNRYGDACHRTVAPQDTVVR